MNEYAILSIHGAVILFGLVLLTPFGSSVASILHGRYPSTTTKRGQLLAGMVFVCFGGFTVSAHTLWMHNKLSEGASVCSGSSILNCDGLIGNVAYNTDPLFGQPWGTDWYGCLYCPHVACDYHRKGADVTPDSTLHQGRTWSDHCRSSSHHAPRQLRDQRRPHLSVLYDCPHCKPYCSRWLLPSLQTLRIR